MLDVPTLGLVIGSAAIDSINPCAIGVLILMVSVILGGSKGQEQNSTRRLLMLGGAYIFAGEANGILFKCLCADGHANRMNPETVS